MNCMKKMYIFALVFSLFFCQKTFSQFVSGCDDLNLNSESFWNGSDGSGSFTSGSVKYLNSYNKSWASWSGFAYSNKTDKTTAGYANQYSAISGKGALNTNNYIIGYGTDTIVFNKNVDLDGFYITNSTYAYLEMLNGSSFSKKFTTNDWFKITIKGYDNNKNKVNEQDYYLADFRFTDNSKNYILNEWRWVDLSLFKNVSYLTFQKTSSDVGTWGMNTPDYFCMDELKVKNYTGIKEQKSSDFKIISNAVLNEISVISDSEINELCVVDLFGKIIYSKNSINDTEISVVLPEKLKGVYVVKMRLNGNIKTAKVLF